MEVVFAFSLKYGAVNAWELTLGTGSLKGRVTDGTYSVLDVPVPAGDCDPLVNFNFH